MKLKSEKKISKECEECKADREKILCWNKEKFLETLLKNSKSIEKNWKETGFPIISEKILNNYEKVGGIDHLEGRDLPSKIIVIEVLNDLFKILFPGYLDKEEITLDTDETGTILLFVTPVKTFVNDTVKLKFTPTSTSEEEVDEEYLEGEPVYLDIVLLNDGSLKDDNDGELPLLEIAIIIIVVAIVILLVYFFFFWRRE